MLSKIHFKKTYSEKIITKKKKKKHVKNNFQKKLLYKRFMLCTNTNSNN